MTSLQDLFAFKHVPRERRQTYRIWVIGGSVCLLVSIIIAAYVIVVGTRAPSPRSYLRSNVSARVAPLFSAEINAHKAQVKSNLKSAIRPRTATSTSTKSKTNALK